MNFGPDSELYRANPSEAEGMFMGWAQGFMSGLNTSLLFMKQETADLQSSAFGPSGQFSHVMRYCDGRPLATVVQAVLDLYRTLRARQGLKPYPN